MGFFSFLAAFGFIAVNIVDPYSGAIASPYFQVAQSDRAVDAQSMVVAGKYETAVDRDGYDVYVKPKPKPKPKPVEKDTTDSGSNSGSGGSAPPAGTPDPGSAKAIAHDMVMARGWGEDQYSCLVALWNRESGWNVYAHNASSGAYGIPQALPGSKMASAGADWQTNPATQITWGLGYIAGRYGSPCGAWAHSQAKGFY
ncbi:lytic transglycosylase domain-containing protein [Microbacterium sp. MPKO10]|uniref:aggregation-promoting factor C-terminal-like domain-containing protein n=1 Tax=Microbacterium sp. MPKO10 TaxID=2989818 RepID=UPI002235AB1B|nr:lytic transglycosylase domain-containing protein [Microbacterium sp. MPKO10]MCW4459351.1 lytic transglycosylase domain-containing protein [Microbacterium sp. MPKO10]